MLRRFLQVNLQAGCFFPCFFYGNILHRSIVKSLLQLLFYSRIDVQGDPVLRAAFFKFCRTVHIQHDAYPGGAAARPHACDLRLGRSMQQDEKHGKKRNDPARPCQNPE